MDGNGNIIRNIVGKATKLWVTLPCWVELVLSRKKLYGQPARLDNSMGENWEMMEY